MKKLALLDLEGTLIDYEFWEALAESHEKGDELKRLLEEGLSTSNWYETFLKRVQMIIGTPKEVIEGVAEKALKKLKPEAFSLISELKRQGFTTMIVSGGFEDFVKIIAEVLGVEDYVAQKLVYHNNEVVGVLPVFKEKGEIVEKLRPWFDLIFAIGDGFNDLKMLQKADVSAAVGKRAKDLAKASNSFAYKDLDELLRDLISGKLKEALSARARETN